MGDSGSMGKQLAVVNVARLRHPLTDRRMTAFVDGIDAINRLAEASPGFVWRRTGVAGHSALLAGSDGDLIVNVSIWQTYLDFHTFTYHGAHGRYFTARERWFVPIPGPTTALWWISEDDRPNVDHALARLRALRREGPSERAFTVLRQWDAQGHPVRRAGRPHRGRR